MASRRRRWVHEQIYEAIHTAVEHSCNGEARGQVGARRLSLCLSGQSRS